MYNEEYDDEQEIKSNDNFLVNFYYNNKVLVWVVIGIFAFIIIMSLLTKGGSSPSGDKYKVTIISSDENVVISIGHNYPLRAKVENNAKAIITWTSEDENIAKVDNGTVTAVNYGKTKIIATYTHSDNTPYTAVKEVVVADGNPNLKLTNVSFKAGDLLMPVGGTYKISLSLTPSNGYITSKEFTSTNEKVVTVDNEGNVVGVGEGEAIINLNVNNGAFRQSLKVYVNKNYRQSEIIISPEKISFDNELRKMKIGSSEKLKYTLFPTDTDASKLIWTSSDETIVKVDENGLARAIKSGTATITLKSVNGISDTIDIEVEEDIVEVTDINLGISNLYLTVGQSETITPTVIPADASNKALSYIPGDTSVISVSANQTGTSATIIALNSGTTTVTVSSGNVEKRISITVTGNSGGNSGGGSSGGSSSGGSSTSGQGFTISSSDANGEKFIVTTYNATINNGATAPVTVTVTKTSSSIAKLRVITCPYTDSVCDPSSASAHETTSSISFPMYNTGTYRIRIGKYNSSGTQTGYVDKFILIQNGSSSGGNSGGGNSGGGNSGGGNSGGGNSGGTNPNSTVSLTCTPTTIKVGEKTTCIARMTCPTCGDYYTNWIVNGTSYGNRTLQGFWTVIGEKIGKNTVTVETKKGERASTEFNVISATGGGIGNSSQAVIN